MEPPMCEEEKDEALGPLLPKKEVKLDQIKLEIEETLIGNGGKVLAKSRRQISALEWENWRGSFSA
jgi:hypothetical protein